MIQNIENELQAIELEVRIGRDFHDVDEKIKTSFW